VTDRQRLALLKKARVALHNTLQGYDDYKKTGKGSAWKAAEKLLDELEAELAGPKVPALAAIVPGGKPILSQDLTHVTSGLTAGGSVWPALDDGVGHPGLPVLAPEALKITGHGRAVRRDGRPDGSSLNLAVGASGLEYWVGHLDSPAPVGARVKRGDRVGVISHNHEAPHVHWAINARPLIGKDLAHHTNYTHGAVLIGTQLAAALA
jgi:hypothetical protein